MFHLIGMIVIGLIVGALAKLFTPGRDPGGIIATILLGIGGSVLAGFIGHAIGWYRPGQGAGIIASILGAMLILYGYKRLTGTTSKPPPD